MASEQSTSEPPRRVSQAELARILGCTRQSINELVKAGKIPVGADGLIDVEQARAAILENVRLTGKTATAAAAGAPAPVIVANEVRPEGEAPSFHIAKTLREAAEAGIARLKYDQMRGELVEKAAVERFTYEAFRSLRDGMTNCSRRLGATVAVLTTPDECAAAIDSEFRTLLQSWSKAMRLSGPPAEPQ